MDRLEQTRDSNKVDRRGLNRCEGVRTPAGFTWGWKVGLPCSPSSLLGSVGTWP